MNALRRTMAGWWLAGMAAGVARAQTPAPAAPPPAVKIEAPAPAPRPPPREALRNGLELYRAGDFERAAASFADAEAGAKDTRLDPAVARYNRALALTRAGKTDEAERLWAEAQQTSDLPLQARAWYNEGLSRVASAEKQAQAQKWQEAVDGYRKALAAYERALTLASADQDSKINHELAAQRLKELEEELKKQQQQQQQQQQQKQDQQKQDQQKQQQQNQKQDPQKQDQQQQDQQKRQEEQQQKQDRQQQKNPSQQGQEKEQQQQQKGPPKQVEEKPEMGGKQQKEATPKAGELSKEEVEAMLSAQQMEEDAMREQLQRARSRPDTDVEKDW